MMLYYVLATLIVLGHFLCGLFVAGVEYKHCRHDEPRMEMIGMTFVLGYFSLLLLALFWLLKGIGSGLHWFYSNFKWTRS